MAVGQCFYVKRLRTLETISGWLSHQIAELIYLTLLLIHCHLNKFTINIYYQINQAFLIEANLKGSSPLENINLSAYNELRIYLSISR